MLQYYGMPRPRVLNKCRGIGVSFTKPDLDWLKETYNWQDNLLISDMVRCAIQDAKFWQAHLQGKPVEKAVTEHGA